MSRAQSALVALGLLAGCAATGSAQSTTQATQTPSSPCAAAEFSQMDFWVGEWDVSWEASPGTPAGGGVNRITKILDGCVVQEAFDGGPSTGGLIGHSVSTFHSAPSLWRQTWVDNQGGYFALTGGPAPDGTFVLTNTRLNGRSPHLRMVFENIQANSLIWRWQRSTDGGVTWTDSWVINYRRRS